MKKKTRSTPETDWATLQQQHQIQIGLSMTPAQRLQWLEDTVEELGPWVGLARKASRATSIPEDSKVAFNASFLGASVFKY